MSIAVLYIENTAINIILAKKNMTRAELCKKAAIDQGNFSTMTKRGTVRPKTAAAIAAALGVDVSEIVKFPPEGNIAESREN